MQQNHVNLVTAFACALLGVSSLAGADLPAGYVRVDYVETRGNQWIDTGYYPGPQTSFEGDVRMVGYYDSRGSGFSMFGAKSGESGPLFSANFSNVTGNEIYFWGGADASVQNHLKGADGCNGMRVKVGFDATTKTFTYGTLAYSGCRAPTETLTTQFGIGGRINAVEPFIQPFQCFNMRIYGWKIWTGEKLERDYVPCVRRQDNVAGLYDLQNGEFKPSAGDPFAYQVPVALPVGYVLADYVETRGNQWIDTGYYPGPQTSFEGDVQMVGHYDSGVSNFSLFGARTGASGPFFSANFSNATDNEILFWGGADASVQNRLTGANACNGRRVKVGFDATTKTFTYGTLTYSGCRAPTSTLTTKFGIGARIITVEPFVQPFQCFRMRIYGWKIWTGATLERDYVPCVRERDNVAGLYDLQNGVFKPSAGDPFIASGGKIKSVLEFSGKAATDCITFDYRPSLSSFSASAWVKNITTGSGDCGVVFSQGSLANFSAGFSCFIAPGSGETGTYTLKCQIRNSQNSVVSAGTDWTDQAKDGTWHLVTVTYDQGSGLCCLYVDAELKASFTQSAGTPVSTQRFTIGARNQDGAFGFPVKGNVAEVSLWDRVLKPKEIKRMLYGQLSGKETGLLGYWPLADGYDRLIPGVAYDCVDNGSAKHDGTWSAGIEVIPGKVGFWPKPGMAIILY